MQGSIDIKHLSRDEKLRVMEAIWEDLSNEDEQIESPDWHKKALQDTEKNFFSGQEEVFDWKEAKNKLRKRFE